MPKKHIRGHWRPTKTTVPVRGWMSSAEARRERGRIGALSRSRAADDAELLEAYRRFEAAKRKAGGEHGAP